jgi:O-acetylhomoserine (thiol)-lyase
VAVLEERIAALEGGVGAIATASGQAALHLAIVTLMGQGGHIVSSASLYGGSHNLFTHTLPRFGITTTFVPPRDHEGFRKAIRPRRRASCSARRSAIPASRCWTSRGRGDRARDRPAADDRQHLRHALRCRPFEHGADLVMHSATKWLGGHGVAIGGVLVDSGRFDWEPRASSRR